MEEEDALTDLTENICNPSKKEGKWIKSLDITRDNSTAQLAIYEHREKVGECRKECKIIQQA